MCSISSWIQKKELKIRIFFTNVSTEPTRKSSCVNTRGILTTVYPVLQLLSYLGGTPSLAGGYSIMGTPCPDLGPVSGVLPRKDMGSVEVLWDGDGVPRGKDMGPVEVLWDGDGDGVPAPPPKV